MLCPSSTEYRGLTSHLTGPGHLSLVGNVEGIERGLLALPRWCRGERNRVSVCVLRKQNIVVAEDIECSAGVKF